MPDYQTTSGNSKLNLNLTVFRYFKNRDPKPPQRLAIVIGTHHHANDGCLSFLTFPHVCGSHIPECTVQDLVIFCLFFFINLQNKGSQQILIELIKLLTYFRCIPNFTHLFTHYNEVRFVTLPPTTVLTKKASQSLIPTQYLYCRNVQTP